MVHSITSVRERWSITGRPVILAAQAARGSRIISCLQPKDPPMGVLMTRMWLMGMPRMVAMAERAPKTDWVAVQTVMWSEADL